MTESPPQYTDALHEKMNQRTLKRWVYWLFPIGGFGAFIAAGLSPWLDYYFVTNEGLDPWVYAFAFLVYGIINAINGPIIGFFLEKEYKWTRKRGRRWPWISIFGPFGPIIYAVIFFLPSPAVVGDWGVGVMLLFALSLADTMGDISGIAQTGLVPEKFRTDKDRRFLLSIQIPLNLFGSLISAFTGILLAFFSYQMAAIVGMIVKLVTFFISLPAMKDPTYFLDYLDNSEKRPNFFRLFLDVIKIRNFWILIVFGMTTTLYMGLLVSTLPFYVRFVLGIPEEQMFLQVVIYQILFILMSIGANWVWLAVGKKLKNYTLTIILANFLMILGAVMIFFVRNPIFLYIWIALTGFGYGHGAPLNFQNMEVADEYAFRYKRREAGIMGALHGIFNRISTELQNFILAAILTITQFDPANPPVSPTPTQTTGITLQLSLIPAAIIFVGLLGYVILWRMPTEKRKMIQAQLEAWKL